MTMRRLGGITTALLLATAMAPAHAQQQSPLTGTWVGFDRAIQEPITLSFREDSAVLLHLRAVLLTTWQFVGSPQRVGGELDYAIDILVLKTLSRRGASKEMPAGEAARTHQGTLRLGAKGVMRLCLSPMGKPNRLAVVDDSHPDAKRCMTLRRAQTELPFDQCVRECVHQNQMRAVGPEAIEADCRRECGGR